jgi:hypothetical protein
LILKNFINLLNLSYLFLFVSLLFLIINFIFNVNVRKKFFLLLILLLVFSGIGIYYNLDGLIMMFFISELSVILIFIVMFSQLYSFNVEKLKQHNSYLLIVFFLINFNYYEVNVILYKNYYSYYVVVLNDFYYIYNAYFEKQIIITILVTLIITFYSIFFILLYFNIKKNSHNIKNTSKNLYLLRKQNILHQSNYNAKIKFFKNTIN